MDVTGNGVAVIGSVSADVTSFSTKLPSPGETILGDESAIVLGGKGANQAVAAAKAGAPTWLVACVGNDQFRELVVSGLEDSGVNTEYLQEVSSPTGLAHIRVNSSDGQNDIVVVPNANRFLSKEYAEKCLRALSDKISIVLLQLEVPAETTMHIAKVAKELGITVILDPAPAKELPQDIGSFVDVITPNESEAEILTGVKVHDGDSAYEAAKKLQDSGISTVVITLADKGCLVLGETKRFYEPYSIDAVDTTAAGDAFAGVLGQSLAGGLELNMAIRRASAAGAIAVTRKGASPSLPSKEELDKFLVAHK